MSKCLYRYHHRDFTGQFVLIAETAYRKLATTIETNPSSITTIFWTFVVSLCCKKQTSFGYSLDNFINHKRNRMRNDQ